MNLIRRLFRGQRAEQSTFLYCPECRNELVKNGTFAGEEEDYSWTYQCSQCGLWSRWDGTAPAPILLDTMRVAGDRV